MNRKTTIQFVLLAVFASCLAGCSALRDQIDERQFERMTEKRAERAWKNSRPLYSKIEHNLHEFGCGFVDGYESVMAGGNGCPPSVPPRRYWKVKYSTPLGKKLIVAWYDGFGHGAAAAFADGVGGSRTLLTAAEIYGKGRPYVEYEPPVDQRPLEVIEDNFEMTPVPGLFLPSPELPSLDEPELQQVPSARPYVPEGAPAPGVIENGEQANPVDIEN